MELLGTTVTPRQRPKASSVTPSIGPISLPNNGLTPGRRLLNAAAANVEATGLSSTSSGPSSSSAPVNVIQAPIVQQLFPTFPQDPFVSEPQPSASNQGYYNYGYAYPPPHALISEGTTTVGQAQSADPLVIDPFRQEDPAGVRASISTSAPRLNPITGRTASLDPPSSVTPPPSPPIPPRGHRRNMSDTSAFNKFVIFLTSLQRLAINQK